jgi:lipopolysaccharide biosynthesis glycosyltransferase
MLRVFIGSDVRQPIGYSVLQHSISTRSSQPVSITRLQIDQLPFERIGLTEFTYTRFLVPWLCDYKGIALFLDPDMLCLDDIADLFAMKDHTAVQVVKNSEKFEWPSLMLFDCSQCWKLTPEGVGYADNIFKMDSWAEVGDLPAEWNHCVGYDKPRGDAKLIHYTQGIPVWPETEKCEYAVEWHAERRAMMGTCSFAELMGNSVHVKHMRENAEYTGN